MADAKPQSRILGIDIGATSIKFAALADRRTLSKPASQPIHAASNADLVKQLTQIIGAPEYADCDQVGIGSPGPLDIDRGVIVASANMPKIRNLAILVELRSQFPGKEFRLDNDANAATLGEKFFGAGKGLENFAVFTLGTGVGGGCIYANKLQRGFNGNFFEVGHVFVGTGRMCGCGNTGCLETIASATGVSNSYAETSAERVSAAEIAGRAATGDDKARHAYDDAGKALGIVAAAITQLMNITTFIFTGGMAAAEAHLRGALELAYKAHTFPLFHPQAKFIFTHGDENAGIYGAAALFLESA